MEEGSFWLENSIDSKAYALETAHNKPAYPRLSFYWLESAKASEGTSAVFAQCARMQQNYPFLCFCLFELYVRYLNKKTQKKIPIMFLEKISFRIMESLLPTYEWRKTREEGAPIYFDARSKSAMVTSWIYQTWSLLNKAGVHCTLSTDPPSINSSGIAITMSKLLNPSFRRHPKSYSFFLVDILGDGAPHAAADLHLFEN